MHNVQLPDPFTNWDDFRVFGETARAGSFSEAARRLCSTQRTISRRILNLERRLDARLFDRLPHGVVLTSAGQAVLDAVREAETRFHEVQRRVLGSDRRLEGRVRIAVTDGLATFWLAPRLGQLQEMYPGISVEFRCSLEPADLMNMESDLAIRFRKPQEADVVALRLGTLHTMPWVSAAYLERFGTPSNMHELRRHRLLDHEAYRRLAPDFDGWLRLLRAPDQHRVSTNSSASLLTAVKNGVAISLLPTYLCEFRNGIEPLDLGVRTRTDVWLAYHRNLRSSARIRVVIDWIKGLFDHATWRWFREDFEMPLSSEGRSATERRAYDRRRRVPTAPVVLTARPS